MRGLKGISQVLTLSIIPWESRLIRNLEGIRRVTWNDGNGEYTAMCGWVYGSGFVFTYLIIHERKIQLTYPQFQAEWRTGVELDRRFNKPQRICKHKLLQCGQNQRFSSSILRNNRCSSSHHRSYLLIISQQFTDTNNNDFFYLLGLLFTFNQLFKDEKRNFAQ